MQLLHIDRESSRAPLRFGPADIGTERSRENSPSQSHYLPPDQVSESQPARVILGSHGGAKSDVLSPERIKKSSGTVTIDTEANAGTVDVVIDTATVDFAHDKLNEHVSSHEILDVAKYPTAEYKGKFVDFANGAPRTVTGALTLHGVTKPVTLTINSFKCIEHPMLKKQVCGADASGSFNRADFGVDYGQQYGFKQDVLLRIQVEGVKAN